MFYICLICGIAVVLMSTFGYFVKRFTCPETPDGGSAADMQSDCSRIASENGPQNSSESRIAVAR